MERIIHYKIPFQFHQKPIDSYLKSMGYSSQNIIALKKMPESILINGVWKHVNYLLQENDTLTIHLKETTSSQNIIPVALPLNIVYEDEDILVVNKPADMPIHPSQNNYENTLANAVMYYYNSQNIPYTFRCINRLDRDTTGLTILAKHMVSAGILSSMVQRREIKREYTALVSGTLPSPSGIIDAPIGRVKDSAIERMIDYEHGEHAITHYQLLKQFSGNELLRTIPSVPPDEIFSQISLWLETGRTHQIRVHMKHLGCPLLGDFLYHPDMRIIDRQALHSAHLTFLHPITHEQMDFTAPLPEDMRIVSTA